ncbi:hypothetical protein OROGR_031694 [Orobanche gracilis]
MVDGELVLHVELYFKDPKQILFILNGVALHRSRNHYDVQSWDVPGTSRSCFRLE